MSGNTSSYLILFVSIAISLVTIYYYMRVIAYLFVGQDANTRGSYVSFELGSDFYSIGLSAQGLLFTLIVL